jgi:hypothetical protein
VAGIARLAAATPGPSSSPRAGAGLLVLPVNEVTDVAVDRHPARDFFVDVKGPDGEVVRLAGSFRSSCR